MWRPNTRALTIDMNCWEERSFVMEAVDSSQTAAMKDGGRAAYIAIFGSSSWEYKRRRVEYKLHDPVVCSTEKIEHLSCA